MKYNLNKLLLVIVGLLLSTTALAHDFEVDGIYYNITNTTAKTVAVTYMGSSYNYYDNEYTGSVIIPSSVTYNGVTYSVASIGSSAFSNCSGLTSITIGNSVTSIGYSAFYNCSGLTLVTISNSVTSIGSYAFAYCDGLTSVTIGNSVTSIGERAFYDCTGLTLVTIGNSVTEIGDEAFYACTGLTEVNYNAENCSSMGSSNRLVFSGCSKLKTLNIGNEVKRIPPSAFKNCDGLTEVIIPNSVTSIGDYAFCDCTGLTEVNYNAENCTSMGSSSSPVFSGCSKLKTLNIGNEVKRIPPSAFYDCDGLTEVIIPNSVTSIGKEAFYACDGLTLITIPNSVTEIGRYAFYGTGWYDNQSDGIFYLDNCCLGYKGDKPTGSLSLKDDTRLIGNEAFYWCDGLTSVTIPNSVTTIGSDAFYACTGLTEVNISDLSAWCKIDFGSSDANPLYYAQMLKLNGSEITNLVIPNDITQIKQYAFFYCNGLTSVTIPNSVTSIGKSAFYYCPSLTSVTIPNSVTKIDYLAFRNCDLRLIMSHCAIPPTCDGVVFGVNGNDNYSALLMIPEGSLIDYALADEWHKFTQVHEVSEATVSTQEKNATFEIPTIEGATKYDVTVYSDITMTQLVATTHYDAYGKITPMSTALELSIDGFDDGVYYYKVLVKSAECEILKNYIGTFEIDAAGIENIATDDAVEVSRYDIHGRLLNEPTRGLNIIKYSDGSTRKEIVK